MQSEQTSRSEVMRQIEKRERAGFFIFMLAMTVFPLVIVGMLAVR